MIYNNLFSVFRVAFFVDLMVVVVETDDGLCYSWQDLECAMVMVVNLL